MFKMKYQITAKYLPSGTGRRPGIPIRKVLFITAHDSGNDGSTALGNISYYSDTPKEKASAHTFIDHTGIYECIPATTGKPEKAWHVQYQTPTDNQRYGDDANDAAIGVELCYFYKEPVSITAEERKRRSQEAYKRYVWYMAYLCYKFKLDPTKDIVGHYTLDPKRKTDPINAFSKIGVTWEGFIKDVANELTECTIEEQAKNSFAGEEDETVKFTEPYQAPMLVSALEELGKKGILNNADAWVEKVKNGTMTASELAWLSIIISTRILMK